jgi:hypothetical protein
MCGTGRSKGLARSARHRYRPDAPGFAGRLAVQGTLSPFGVIDLKFALAQRAQGLTPLGSNLRHAVVDQEAFTTGLLLCGRALVDASSLSSEAIAFRGIGDGRCMRHQH